MVGTESGGIVSPWKCNRNQKPPNGTLNPDTAVPPTLSLRYIAFTASVLRIFCLFVPHTLNTTERCLPCFIPLGIVVVKMGPVLRKQKDKKASEGERAQVSLLFLLFQNLDFRGKKNILSGKELQKEKLHLFLPYFSL